MKRRTMFAMTLLPCVLGLAAGATAAPPGMGQQETVASAQPPELAGLGIQQLPGAAVPLDATFRDEEGKTVRIGDLLDGKPAILALVYYECPMLCTLVLNGLAQSLGVLPLDAGEDFTLIAVSIDPEETPELAAGKRDAYVERYDRPAGARGWRFLTGEEDAIDAVADAVGFRYRYDEETDLYAHAAGIMVLTPDGKVSRYFLGVEYSPKDLRLALVEAAQGTIGSVVDQVLLYCYRYDPATGRYGVVIYRIMRIGGVLTVLGLVGFIVGARLVERRRTRERTA